MYIHSRHNLKLTSERASERASRRDNMKKYRLICHVNHIRYKDVNAKNEEQAQEMLEDIQDYDNWEYGKEYGESYVEEIKQQASEQ